VHESLHSKSLVGEVLPLQQVLCADLMQQLMTVAECCTGICSSSESGDHLLSLSFEVMQEGGRLC
jgi:hypothetical protein